MGHRAALYRVRVRAKRDVQNWRVLGDYDEVGTWIGDPISRSLHVLKGRSQDGRVDARFEAALINLGRDQVGVTVLSGRSGITSVIERGTDPPFDRTPQHSEAMRSAVLFDLPRGRTSGVLAVHVPHGRSCKSILDKALRNVFGPSGFVLDLSPIVPATALEQALREDALERVTLIKHDPSKTERFRDAARWGNDAVRQIELSIPSHRHKTLKRDPILKFLRNPTDANRRDIVEFAGLTFDEAAVTVDMADGSQRRFYLEPREGGHPMTIGIEVTDDDRLGANAIELSSELRRAVTSGSTPRIRHTCDVGSPPWRQTTAKSIPGPCYGDIGRPSLMGTELPVFGI